MEVVDWLRLMLANEMEVRAPRSRKSELKFIQNNCVLLQKNGEYMGFAELRTMGKSTEITTFVIDPKVRGKGYGKLLIEECIKQSKSDYILSCTKNAAMSSLLEKCGFSQVRWPGLVENFWITVNTFRSIFQMLLLWEWKRLWHKGKGIFSYKKYQLKR